MKLKIFLIFLILLISCSIPVHAYLPIDLTISDQTLKVNCNEMDCQYIPEENKTYCLISCEGGGQSLYLFDENYTLVGSCDVYTWITGIKGIALYNKTTAFLIVQTNSNLYEADLSLMISSGICTQRNVYSLKQMGYCGGSVEQDEKAIYWSETNRVVNLTGDFIRYGYWSGDGVVDFSLRNYSNNETAYTGIGTRDDISLIGWYINGVWENGLIPKSIWNVDNLKSLSVEQDYYNNTWLYVFNEGSSSSKWNLYKMNLTKAETEPTNYLTNLNIEENETLPDGSFCFEVYLTTEVNGTLMWFVNSVNEYNETVETAPFNNTVYRYCRYLEAGNYTVYVQYIDDNNNIWDTSEVNFFVTEQNYFTNFLDFIVDVFKLDGRESVLLIISVLISFVIAFIITKYIDARNKGQIFLASLFIMIFVFWVIGWIPSLYILPVFVILALLLVSELRKSQR